jgi:hypothetical protein
MPTNLCYRELVLPCMLLLSLLPLLAVAVLQTAGDEADCCAVAATMLVLMRQVHTHTALNTTPCTYTQLIVTLPPSS